MITKPTLLGYFNVASFVCGILKKESDDTERIVTVLSNVCIEKPTGRQPSRFVDD